MHSARGFLFVVAASLFLSASLSHAQSTVAEVLNSGGKQLVKTELAVLLTDITLRNRNDQNARLTTRLKADGTMTGSGISSTGHEFNYQGNWTITGANQICFDTLTQFGRGSYCETLYKVGDKYFYASDPSGLISGSHRVFERSISKP